MQMQHFRLRACAIAAGIAMLAYSGWASADPSSRVARLGYASGAVSFSPAGESDWVRATINRPLTTGDRLWVEPGARAEVQVGGAVVRLNAATSVSVLNLDDRTAQLQLTQGTLNVRVLRLAPGQVFEVDTPNLAFTLRQPGAYRIEVDPDGYATTIVVRKGQGEAYGEGAAYAIDARQPYRFSGTGLRDYEVVDAPRPDDFDRWASDRDRGYDNSDSARYVSPDVVGYQDLDANGSWRVDASYGNVWTPNRVAAGWAPYRDGHWAWVDPWGWTWVDDAPWGFAVSHYGRWANFSGTWGWVPGPAQTRAYYAPALVAFVGGSNFQISISTGNVGGVAWFPLGPREVYRPSYPVSRGYFENVNRSNTVINNTVINNTYNTTNVTNVIYANRQVPGAVIAVPTTAFVQSQPVSRAAVQVSREMLVSRPVAVAPAVVPTDKSVHGAAAQGDRPPARVFERPVVARATPPAPHVGFAAQQQQLSAQPGKPLDDAARRALKPVTAAPIPVVKVIAPTQVAPNALRAPPAVLATKPGGTGSTADERKAPAMPAISGAPGTPGAPAQVALPAQGTPRMSAAPPLEPRGTSDGRGKSEQRVQPIAPPPAVSPAAAQPQVAPTQDKPPVAPPQSAQPRGNADQRGDGAQRVRPVAPPPLPQRANESRGAAPSAVPPASAIQAPPQRAAPPRMAPPPPQVAAPEPRAPARPQSALPAPPVRPAPALEPARSAQQAQPRPPVAAPTAAHPPQPLAANAEQPGHEPKPAASKPSDNKANAPQHDQPARNQN